MSDKKVKMKIEPKQLQLKVEGGKLWISDADGIWSHATPDQVDAARAKYPQVREALDDVFGPGGVMDQTFGKGGTMDEVFGKGGTMDQAFDSPLGEELRALSRIPSPVARDVPAEEVKHVVKDAAPIWEDARAKSEPGIPKVPYYIAFSLYIVAILALQSFIHTKLVALYATLVCLVFCLHWLCWVRHYPVGYELDLTRLWVGISWQVQDKKTCFGVSLIPGMPLKLLVPWVWR